MESDKQQLYKFISQQIYNSYKDRFLCVNIQKNKWCEFQSHRWTFIKSSNTLEELITNDFEGILSNYYSAKFPEPTATQKEESGTKIVMLKNKIADVKFREYIIRACANKF